MALRNLLGWHTGHVAKWREIADDLQRQIASGELPPGSLTKSRRELAEQYGVADGTSKRALDYLVAEGVLESVAKVGFMVTGAERGTLAAQMLDHEERIARLERLAGLSDTLE